MDENKTEIASKTCYLRIKRANLEFEVEGTEEYVQKMFEQFKIYIDAENIDESPDTTSEEQGDDISSDIDLTPKEEETPLDVYFGKLDTSNAQKKCIAVALYLIDVKKIEKFQSGDINKLLKENKLSPLENVANEANRARKKGIFTLIPGGGGRKIFTIYKDAIDKARNFVNQ